MTAIMTLATTEGLDMPMGCEHAISMSKMVQLKNVPDDLHRVLKARAAMEGMSLSDYLIAEVRRSAERPTPREIRERLAKLTPVVTTTSAADAVRAVRDAE
jgi:antitoxin FitA